MKSKNYIKCKNSFQLNDNVNSKLLYGNKCESKDILVSICIPTVNRVDLLKEAILSCLNQKSNTLNFEILVVDNNTDMENDNELLIRNMDNPIIKYYQNERNLGIFGNWNRCIELARGKWVSLLHDDDLLMLDCFQKWEKILKCIKDDSKVGYIKTSSKYFYNISELKNKEKLIDRIKSIYSNKFFKVNHFDYAVTGTPGIYGMPTAGTLLNRSAVIKVGGYNNEFYPSDDAYMPVRLSDNGYKVIKTISNFGFYRYAVNESQKSEIHYGWIKEFLSFQSFLKSYGNFYHFFVTFFEDEQLYLFVHQFIFNFISEKEKANFLEKTNKIKRVKKNVIKLNILKILIKAHYCNFYFRALFTRRTLE